MPSRPITPEYRTILVPLDGSALAESALPVASALATTTHAQLVVAKVHEPPKMAMTNAFQWNREVAQRELDYLACVAGRLERSIGICAHTRLLGGSPADALRAAASHDDKTLIIMSSHGRTGFSRFWLGSVADAVVRNSRTPVLIARSSGCLRDVASGQIGRVLVPLDGSAVAESILPAAMWLCRATGALLELLHVMRPEEIPLVDPMLQEDATHAAIREAKRTLGAVAERLSACTSGTSIKVVVRVHESAAAAINDYAAVNGVKAVALTTRGFGLARLMGGVADKVIRDGPPLILLLRPPDVEEPGFPAQPLH